MDWDKVKAFVGRFICYVIIGDLALIVVFFLIVSFMIHIGITK